MTFARTVLLSLALQQASAGYYSGIVGQFGTYDAIAGYTPASDVTAHAAIDLDMTAINDYAGSGDFDSAIDMYKNGGNSAKGSGWRTLHGFGVKDLSGETEYDMGVTYWGSATYANDIVMAALNGTDYSDPKGSTSVTLTDTQRSQIISKGAAYINAWIYALHELYEAEEKCEMYVSDKAGYFAAGYAHPYKEMHYWDEGWAFYAGSQQEVGSTSTGDLAYELAEKRCSDFDTCGPAGYVEGDGGNQDGDFRPSLVNRNLIGLYNVGLVMLNSSDCTGVSAVISEIVKQMTIPLIQGTIKYVFKSDPAASGISSTTSDNEKSMAEGWAFAAALLPLLNAVDSSAADTLYNNINMGLGTSGAVPDGYAAVKTAIEGTYSALNITCADVGEYYGMLADSDYVECSGLTAGTATVYSDLITMGGDDSIDSEWPFPNIAGYAPPTNVIDHSQIDLDMMAINTAAGSLDYATAIDVYTNGGNSAKGTGWRTLKGFSKDLTGETEWDAGYAYYGSATYADDIVSGALSGSATYAITPSGYTAATAINLTDTQRSQIISKGTAYINAWIYSLHELYEALAKCASGVAGTDSYDHPEKEIHYWDEGWAFYAGSAQEVGSTSTSDLAYELAEKRCGDFTTCGAAGDSDSTARPSLVNRNLLYLYNLGVTQLLSADCDSATITKNYIVSQMTIPLIQGTLKYVYKSDPAVTNTADPSANEKSMAEGWAFASALLPLVDACDSTVSKTLFDNINMGLGTSGAVPDGYATVVTAIESTYSCLGVTCYDVGAYSPMTVCSDGSTAATVMGPDVTLTAEPTASPVAGPSPTTSPVVATATETSGASRGAISTAAAALATIIFAVMQL